MSKATFDELNLCPGFGKVKARRVKDAFEKPFYPGRKAASSTTAKDKRKGRTAVEEQFPEFALLDTEILDGGLAEEEAASAAASKSAGAGGVGVGERQYSPDWDIDLDLNDDSDRGDDDDEPPGGPGQAKSLSPNVPSAKRRRTDISAS